MAPTEKSDLRKTEEIYQDILAQISKGKWAIGQKLPTERVFSEQYGVSRPTMGRILNRLKDSGHIKRVVGAGTFLTNTGGATLPVRSRKIGLFVPGLGKGEIFEPICANIAELSTEQNISLIWGGPPSSSSSSPALLIQAAKRLIEQDVQGVFFQPVEREKNALETNLQIAELFRTAKVEIVLLDADLVPFPQKSPYDLVGIDNIAAAYQLTKHFTDQGAERVDFVWSPYTANTLTSRIKGYREALLAAGIQPTDHWLHEGDSKTAAFASALIDSGARNFICSNDEIASQLMRSLEELGLRVPEDVRLAGFDDVKYAHMLKVPLTTVRQPCRALAQIALRTMIDRLSFPHMPPTTVTLAADLCLRRSSRFSQT